MDYLLQLAAQRGMQGAVHVLSFVFGFTIRLGQFGLTRWRPDVCVCSRGGMAGCLVGTWWGCVHVPLRAANDCVLVGARVIVGI